MIIDRLILHNFGIYRGRHEISLTPESDKPIILFGGLNGGGKTTFLDAILLALYGKFAECSGRGGLGYEQFLADCINRDVSKKDGASVTLEFRQWHGGEVEVFAVTRAWRNSGKSVQETVDVYRDGVRDPETADRWYEVVEEVLPSRIAKLFFFDGEKIEDLAGQEKSASLIATGLQTLLGLDLVSTLESDLVVLRRRKVRALDTTTAGDNLGSLEDAADRAEARRKRLVAKRAALMMKYEAVNKEGDRLRDKYRRLGGELFEQRDALQAEHEAQLRALSHLDDRLRDLASGIAPLCLLRPQLKSAREAAIRDKKAAEAAALVETLVSRDEELLAFFDSLEESRSVKNKVSDFLKKDRDRYASYAADFVGLDIDPTCFGAVEPQTLDETLQKVRVLLLEHRSLQEALMRTERKMAGIPDPDGLRGISAQLSDNQKSRLKFEHELETLSEEIAHAQNELEQANERYRNAEKKAITASFSQERIRQSVQSIERIGALLQHFRERLIAQHTKTLEDHIFQSYNTLIRKNEFLSHIEIDPSTCELKLFSHGRAAIAPGRLSAGERQLLVVSILWGLMKASGRALPTVIDTPLGRLDSEHRTNLVENYFPAASHQVILLSTDQEIDEEYYRRLLPYITHDYRLYYDEKSRSSRVIDGYFWRGAA